MSVINKLASKAVSGIGKTMGEIGKTTKSLVDAKDLKMIAMRLELATTKNGEYRFNSNQINELTELFKQHSSENSVSEILKNLLDVGVKKGETLSFEEIKNFLEVTKDINTTGQKRIIKFMRALKEREVQTYDAKYIKEHSSLSDFKEKVSKSSPWTKDYSEEKWQELYRNLIRQEIYLASHECYSSARSVKPSDVTKYINNSNRLFVEGVAQCDKPEVIAKLVEKTGVNSQISLATKELGELYEMSEGNMTLLIDLVKGFYPSEIKQIYSKLLNKKSANLASYTRNIDLEQMNSKLSTQRNRVLKELGLTGKIDLLPLEEYTRIPSNKIYSGSFEQGKRR